MFLFVPSLSVSQDMEVYAASYEGLAKIKRLMFVAKHCPGLAEDALKYNIRSFIYTCTLHLHMGLI